ncbi:GPO family capsid scaffolding protein [Pseudoxanthomonas sp. PXM02]|uniref:GPO family capsid scaffolding protein n=1 Tax=Pseudoxanthomonas sp. PXM02 TaxID=2769294 RepID=UPI00177EAFBC|nr:GPO family capsid scaffolding protein [Pseudoxanthomonas sp. PXM02]MBD9478507.1 GPO family capsid scaffolding protein [Pseudoxanthomonas sp. PXM02]
MSGQTKKFRSKFFRIAVEGDATDGRVIERQWLLDAAATYSQTTYAARIWMEHFRSMLPDSPFRAYGDVTALKTEEVEIDGKKKLALFAQIEPTDDLVKIVNVQKQKLYTSMEISPKFANTGKAYLTGLGITDSPASLGTERLAFSAQHPEAKLFGERKQHADNLFSAAGEVEMAFEEVITEPTATDKLFNVLSTLAERLTGAATKVEPKPDAPPAATQDFSAIATALAGIGDHLKTQGESFAQLQRESAEQNATVKKLQTDFADLYSRLDNTPNGAQPVRPPANGTKGTSAVTDC